MKFIAKEYRQLLASHGLDTFPSIWDAKVDWFEEPNERRGGWSGVGKLNLSEGDCEKGIFLKRQQNHQRRTLKHPVFGQPTFASEFAMIQYLARNGVPSLKPVAFGVRPSSKGEQAILMTEELAGFQSLESLTEMLFSKKRASISEQNQVLRQVARTVSKLHFVGVQHRSLYPKHLFVHKDPSKDVVVIDLEKSRIKWLGLVRTLYDLATLNRHAQYWSKTRRLYFYLQYLGEPRLTTFSKWLCRLIIRRSNRVKK